MDSNINTYCAKEEIESPLSLSQISEGLDKLKSNNPKIIIDAVAKILHTRLMKDKFDKPKINNPIYRNHFRLFTEDNYFTIDSNVNELKKEQTIKDISDFIEAILYRAELPPEYSIICLIYIHFFQAKTEFHLQNSNLRTFIFVSIVIAQKIYDDNVVTNKYFAEEIYQFYTNEELNKLELVFTILMDFKFYVKMNEYTKFCQLVEEQIITTDIFNRFGFMIDDSKLINRKVSKSSTIVNCYRD